MAEISTKYNIWLLEDNRDMHEILREILESDYDLRSFFTLGEFFKAVESSDSNPYDLAIVDNRLNDGNLSDYLESPQANRMKSLPPFILITGYDEKEDIYTCFKHGAVDYIRKPFNEFEIKTKIDLHLTNNVSEPSQIKFDNKTLTLTRDDIVSEDLTAKEYKMMAVLMESPRFSASKEVLIEKIWQNLKVDDRVIKVHFSNLRRKIAPLGLKIEYQNSQYIVIDS